MTYLKLKNNRIRISLTKHETIKLFGSAEGLDKNDPKTSLTLKMLFKKAASDNNFEVSSDNVWIEVARNLSGGYDIYFTKNLYPCILPKASALTLEFEHIDAAIMASKSAITSKSRVDFSRFYRFFDRYRIVTLSKNGICDIPSVFEFADSMLTSRLDVAKTMEYGKLLIKDNAFEILSKL